MKNDEYFLLDSLYESSLHGRTLHMTDFHQKGTSIMRMVNFKECLNTGFGFHQKGTFAIWTFDNLPYRVRPSSHNQEGNIKEIWSQKGQNTLKMRSSSFLILYMKSKRLRQLHHASYGSFHAYQYI